MATLTELIVCTQAYRRVDVPNEGLLCEVAPHANLRISAVRQSVKLDLGIS